MDSSATETEDETTQDELFQPSRKKQLRDHDDSGLAAVQPRKKVKRSHRDDGVKRKWQLKHRVGSVDDGRVCQNYIAVL